MSFFALRDYKNRNTDHSKYMVLRLELGSGINTVPDMDINITKLNKKGSSRYNHFFNNGFGGITFKIKTLIKSSDMWNNKTVVTQLNNWFKNMTPLHVVTEAIDVPDGEYIISKNPSRQQNKRGFTEWELEFTSYTPLSLYKYKNDNTAVKKAIKKAKKAQQKKSATTNKKLSKCNYKVLKYSKTKKVVNCVKYLQKILKKQKCYTGKIDGWYGKDTKAAVKKFQKKYNKQNAKSKTIKGTGSGIIVTAGKQVTNTKNKNIDIGKNVKIKKSNTGKNTVLKPNKLVIVLPENGKVNKDTFKVLCKS